MNIIKKISILAAAGLLFGAAANAQGYNGPTPYNNGGNGKVKLNLWYNYSLPTGSFKNDFVKDGSPRGFGADVLYWAKPTWSIGGAFGFQDYYQKYDRDMYKLSDGSDVSAVLSNSLQTIPITVKSMYSPLADKGTKVQPYVSAAAGVNIVNYSQYLGEFTGQSGTSAHFTALAGAGVKIPFGSANRVGLLIGANYQFSPYNKYDIKNLNAFNAQAGIQFRLR